MGGVTQRGARQWLEGPSLKTRPGNDSGWRYIMLSQAVAGGALTEEEVRQRQRVALHNATPGSGWRGSHRIQVQATTAGGVT